jgi:hypothetical protein
MENAWNSFPSQSAEEKKAEKSVPNDLIEEKNTLNFVISSQTIPLQIKMFEIPFQTISQKRKTLGIL